MSCFGRPDRRWVGAMAQLLQMAVLSPFVSHKLVSWVEKPSKEDLFELKDLVETGKVKPVIDRTYTLRKVPEALRCLEQGHARGKIVIRVSSIFSGV